MEALNRIVRLHATLRERRGPISVRALQEQLECSRPTLYRAIAHLRDQLGAPVLSAPGRGIFYDRSQPVFELPGLWLGADELRALLVAHDLLGEVEPGILGEYVRPLRSRIEQILAGASDADAPPHKQLRVIRQHARAYDGRRFATVSGALARQRKIALRYRGRERARTTERTVSPQRLVYYRDNWYLDAWCHTANGLRTFSLDRIDSAEALNDPATTIEAAALDEELASSYGIFSGPPKHTAQLRFAPHAARWVADERWHPQQQGQLMTDGSYELRVPYGDARELLRDILRYGADVRVLAPGPLVRKVRDALTTALGRYRA